MVVELVLCAFFINTTQVGQTMTPPAQVSPSEPIRIVLNGERTRNHRLNSTDAVYQKTMLELRRRLTDKGLDVRMPMVGAGWTNQARLTDLFTDSEQASYVLSVVVDRPLSKWMKLTVHCNDRTGQLLWSVEQNSTGNVSLTSKGGVDELLSRITDSISQRLLLKQTPAVSARVNSGASRAEESRPGSVEVISENSANAHQVSDEKRSPIQRPSSARSEIRWYEGCSACKRIMLQGEPYMYLEHNGVAIMVSFTERHGYLAPAVGVRNTSNDDFLVNPGLFRLRSGMPNAPTEQASLHPQEIRRRAEQRRQISDSLSRVGAALESSGTPATEREAGSVLDQQGRKVGSVTVKQKEIGPAERMAAQTIASNDREMQKLNGRLEGAALLENTVFAGQSVSGEVYFRKPKRGQVHELVVYLRGQAFVFPYLAP